VLVAVVAAGTAVCFAEHLVEVVPLDIAVHHLDLVDIVGFVAADLVVDPDFVDSDLDIVVVGFDLVAVVLGIAD
jgi:hypothetical protein